MLQPGGDLDLAEEAVGPEGGGSSGRSTFTATLRSVLQVLGQVDGGHAALAELALDAVAVGEGGGERGQFVLVQLGLSRERAIWNVRPGSIECQRYPGPASAASFTAASGPGGLVLVVLEEDVRLLPRLAADPLQPTPPGRPSP